MTQDELRCTCGNPKHPNGSWHEATPLPASWEILKRIRFWIRTKLNGCGCEVKMSDELCRKCETEEIKRYVNPVLKTNGPDVLATNGKVKFKAEEIELIEHHKGKYVLYADHITQVEKARRENLENFYKWLEETGYLDSDWLCEEPTAIDRYLSLRSKINGGGN